MTLGELVRKAREDKGWDQTQLANAAGYSQAAISDIEAGRTVAPRAWRKLSEALGIEEESFRAAMISDARPTPQALSAQLKKILAAYPEVTPKQLREHFNLGAFSNAVAYQRYAEAEDMLKAFAAKSTIDAVTPNATITGPVDRPDPNSIPVHGRAKGGDDGKYEFNGDVIGWEPRPAKLRGISGVYAVYIDGESMYPRYKAGETVVAQPGRPIARGDDVIVQLAADEENEAPYGYVKEFVRWTPTKLVLSQFNPKQEIEFARDQVVSVHRIVHADR